MIYKEFSEEEKDKLKELIIDLIERCKVMSEEDPEDYYHKVLEASKHGFNPIDKEVDNTVFLQLVNITNKAFKIRQYITKNHGNNKKNNNKQGNSNHRHNKHNNRKRKHKTRIKNLSNGTLTKELKY